MPGCSTAKNPQGIEITFTEDNHKYLSVIDGQEIQYVSGTTFIGQFFKPFDPNDEIAKRCAVKEGCTLKEIKDKWANAGRIATVFGTKVHETVEDTLLQHKYRNVAYDEKEEKCFKYAKAIGEKFLRTIDILGVEKIVFNHKLKIAGTIDLFARSRKTGDYLIIDHKTNKEIPLDNKWNNFALDPISHVPDTSYGHYCLQLNLYSYLLKYGNYVPKDAKFKYFLNHITESGVKLIEVPDMQIEIRDLMIEHLLKNR